MDSKILSLAGVSVDNLGKLMAILILLVIAMLPNIALSNAVIPTTATIILKDGTEVYGQISQQELAFHTKEGKLRIRLEDIKSFESGKLELRDGSIISGELKEDLSVMSVDGTVRALKKGKIVSIVIENISVDTASKGPVEALRPEGGEGIPIKVPPPPPPPNYTKIFKDASKENSVDDSNLVRPDRHINVIVSLPREEEKKSGEPVEANGKFKHWFKKNWEWFIAAVVVPIITPIITFFVTKRLKGKK